MMNIVRSEWLKLRTGRVNAVLAILAGLFPLIVVVLVSALGSHLEDWDAEGFVGMVNSTMVVTALLLGVIGAINLTGEFGHGTIRTTFASVPQRGKVLIIKAVISLLATLGFAAIVAAICVLSGRSILTSRGAILNFESNNYSALGGVVALCGLLSLFAYGLGLLIRNSPATVVLFVLWPLLLEGIVALILSVAGVDNPSRWLPYQRAFQMADPAQVGNRWASGLYLGGVTLVLIAAGIIVNDHRDA